ncbi:MAG TPA: HAD family phosphatase [Microvirga sp.]|nr:HAD family phosphatase [Microvirga sp.]
MPSLPMPTAVVCDMDGLLFDTEALHLEAVQAAAQSLGREMPVALFHRMVGQPWPANHALLLTNWGTASQVEALRERWHHGFVALAATRLVLKPGAADLLTSLDELGIPYGIATSSGHDDVRANLTAHSLLGRFRTVVAFGDYAKGKPAPDPYRLAAERLGVEAGRCWALEDSYNGVRSASAAGMVTIMVPDLLPPTDEVRALCAAVLPDLYAVRNALMSSQREHS